MPGEVAGQSDVSRAGRRGGTGRTDIRVRVSQAEGTAAGSVPGGRRQPRCLRSSEPVGVLGGERREVSLDDDRACAGLWALGGLA